MLVGSITAQGVNKFLASHTLVNKDLETKVFIEWLIATINFTVETTSVESYLK